MLRDKIHYIQIMNNYKKITWLLEILFMHSYVKLPWMICTKENFEVWKNTLNKNSSNRLCKVALNSILVESGVAEPRCLSRDVKFNITLVWDPAIVRRCTPPCYTAAHLVSNERSTTIFPPLISSSTALHQGYALHSLSRRIASLRIPILGILF